MENEKAKKKLISANEINRFVYCPYQWHYKRHYGVKELTIRYKALGKESSGHESHFEKGLKHHQRHYFKYKLKRGVTYLFFSGMIGAFLWYLFSR
jgi:hypothetical protein